MSDTEWFDKDLDDFDIPGYQPSNTGCPHDDYEAELDASEKLNLLKLNFEDTSLPASSANKKQQNAASMHIRSYLTNNSPDVLVTILNRHPKGLLTLFKGGGMTKEFLSLSLQLVALISDSSFSATKTRFLDNVLNDTDYWDQLYLALKKVLESALRRNFSKEKFWAQKFYDDFTIEIVWNCLIKVLWNCSNEMVAHQKILKFTKLLEKNKYLIEFPEAAQSRTRAPLFPTLNELLNGPDNKIDAAYRTETTDLYLQRNLAILREDFFLPIRREITELRRNERCQQLRVYPNARIQLAKNQFNLCTVEVQASRDSLKDFMYGSLLIFTSSMEFPDLIYAIVDQNDAATLGEGFVNIEIKHIEGNCGHVLDSKLIMIACETFFQPYHHVYNALSSLNERNFPLKRFIIDVDASPAYPDYLYDRPKAVYTHKYYKFDVKSSQYPTTAQLKLNPSQLKAFRAGLASKFCIIQGPCGTGKTFIGLEILSAILANTDKRILIVCYTNHALDQFLMGLLRHTKSIVRFGSQSKNEILDVFNVKNLDVEMVGPNQHYRNELKREQHNLLEQFASMQQSGCEEFQDILAIQDKLCRITQQIEEHNQMVTFRQLLASKRRVVGMTTTCAARLSPMLKALKIEIVMIEEAAQILESHVVAALTEHTQHLIMIGDHQQLRPINSEHSFKRLYNIDVSLMERLINSGFQYVRLNVQHRMRPEIADLIRPHIYADLVDDESVKGLPNVKGMATNMFFVNHGCFENEVEDETTKNNTFEAKYLICLCNYLRLQGHPSRDITILCTYNGQKALLSKLASEMTLLKGVTIVTVDNYQGEENTIILLSLVRSNDRGSIGFLGEANRVCVALSRARKGLYIVGNMEFLAQNSSLWMNVRGVLEQKSAIDEKLTLKCGLHRTVAEIHSLEDFQLINSVGCNIGCGGT